MKKSFAFLFAVLVGGCARVLLAQGSVEPTVTIYATDAHASEAGSDPGTFTVTRTGSTNFTVIVFYNLSGTASNGVDYEQLGGSVQIPAGDLAASFTVKPIDDALVEGDETVVAEIVPSPLDCATCGYTIGTPSNAVVVIADNDTGTNHPPFVRLNSPQEGDVFTAPATIRNVPSLPMNPFTRIPVFVTVALAFLLAAPPTRAVDTNSTVRPGGFQFDGKISRPVLENYLSRSICIEGC